MGQRAAQETAQSPPRWPRPQLEAAVSSSSAANSRSGSFAFQTKPERAPVSPSHRSETSLSATATRRQGSRHGRRRQIPKHRACSHAGKTGAVVSVAPANNAADGVAAKAGTDCHAIAIQSDATDSSNKFTDSLRMQVADHDTFALSPRLAVANRLTQRFGMREHRTCSVDRKPHTERPFNGYRHFRSL